MILSTAAYAQNHPPEKGRMIECDPHDTKIVFAEENKNCVFKKCKSDADCEDKEKTFGSLPKVCFSDHVCGSVPEPLVVY